MSKTSRLLSMLDGLLHVTAPSAAETAAANAAWHDSWAPGGLSDTAMQRSINYGAVKCIDQSCVVCYDVDEDDVIEDVTSRPPDGTTKPWPDLSGDIRDRFTWVKDPVYPSIRAYEDRVEFFTDADGVGHMHNASNNSVVDYPEHYTSHPSGVEMTDIAMHYGFLLGNVIKYVWRADLKGEAVEDLRKAAWYLQREIERREEDA